MCVCVLRHCWEVERSDVKTGECYESVEYDSDGKERDVEEVVEWEVGNCVREGYHLQLGEQQCVVWSLKLWLLGVIQWGLKMGGRGRGQCCRSGLGVAMRDIAQGAFVSYDLWYV